MLRRTLATLALVAMALSTSGCHYASFVTNRPMGQTVVDNNPFFLWGLAGHNTFDVRRVCPNGVSRVDTYMSFVDALLAGITIGIYSPRTVAITCAAGRAEAPKRVMLGMSEAGELLEVAIEETSGVVRHADLAEVLR